MAQAGRGGGGAKGGNGGAGAADGKGAGSNRSDSAMGGGQRGGGGNSSTTGRAPVASPSAPPSPSLGRQIADLFGGPVGYANNPNAPHYDTKAMGVPVDMPWSSVMFGPNFGMPKELGIGVGLMGLGSMGIGPGMAATRAIQSMTGMSGGPSIGGRSDGMGAYGGAGGTANAGMGMGGALRPSEAGYQLPQGYMQQSVPPAPVAPMTPPQPSMLNQPGKWLSPTPGYGVQAPGYSYFGPIRT